MPLIVGLVITKKLLTQAKYCRGESVNCMEKEALGLAHPGHKDSSRPEEVHQNLIDYFRRELNSPQSMLRKCFR